MPTFAFSGGRNGVLPYGDQWKIQFIGTWNSTDTWSIAVTSTDGNATWGLGNFNNLATTTCFTYKERIYLGLTSRFNFSENNDPTNWEVQSPLEGAGFELFLSQFGSQDSVFAISQLQGRLAVFGRRSVQLWTVDADPNNFSIVQNLDNIGTSAPLSVQSIGDFDVFFLDDTGIRSLRVMEVTLNATIDDPGSAIDGFIQTALVSNNANTSVSIVEPSRKQYWLYLGGSIYVFSKYPSDKVAAWSTFNPTDQVGTTFVPLKMVILNGQVYIRGTDQGTGIDYLYLYGDTNNTTYDSHTPVTVQLPWLSGGGKQHLPDTLKQQIGCSAVWQGKWTLKIATDPQSGTYKTVIPARGSATSPNEMTDSTYDLRNYSIPGMLGTHFSLQATSTPGASTTPAILSSITFRWNDAGKQ